MQSQPITPTSRVESERTILRLTTQETRHDIIQITIGHPDGLPTLCELDYYNPQKTKSTIREHLSQLIDHGIFERVELSQEKRTRDNPYVFYGITEQGIHFLTNHSLVDDVDQYRTSIAHAHKSKQIQNYENAPRPESRTYTI